MEAHNAESNETGEASRIRQTILDNKDWFWQCHKCSHPNPMPARSRNFKKTIHAAYCVSPDNRCFHERCNDCYDLTSQLEVLRFCSGAPVDLAKYKEWHSGFDRPFSADFYRERLEEVRNESIRQRMMIQQGKKVPEERYRDLQQFEIAESIRRKWRMVVRDGKIVTERYRDTEEDINGTSKLMNTSVKAELRPKFEVASFEEPRNARDVGIKRRMMTKEGNMETEPYGDLHYSKKAKITGVQWSMAIGDEKMMMERHRDTEEETSDTSKLANRFAKIDIQPTFKTAKEVTELSKVIRKERVIGPEGGGCKCTDSKSWVCTCGIECLCGDCERDGKFGNKDEDVYMKSVGHDDSEEEEKEDHDSDYEEGEGHHDSDYEEEEEGYEPDEEDD